jgi:hypothetical protein
MVCVLCLGVQGGDGSGSARFLEVRQCPMLYETGARSLRSASRRLGLISARWLLSFLQRLLLPCMSLV